MYLNMVEKMKKQETRRRINILNSVRAQMRIRFMRLYRMFRHKKYGESLEEEKIITETDLNDENNIDEEEKKEKKFKVTKKRSKKAKVESEDLQTVMEEESLNETDLLSLTIKPEEYLSLIQ